MRPDTEDTEYRDFWSAARERESSTGRGRRSKDTIAGLKMAVEKPRRAAHARSPFIVVPLQEAAEEFFCFQQRSLGADQARRATSDGQFYSQLAHSIKVGEFERSRRLTVVSNVRALRSRLTKANFPPIDDTELVVDGYLKNSWASVRAATAWCNRHGLPVPARWSAILARSGSDAKATETPAALPREAPDHELAEVSRKGRPSYVEKKDFEAEADRLVRSGKIAAAGDRRQTQQAAIETLRDWSKQNMDPPYKFETIRTFVKKRWKKWQST